ncbi:ectonucleotide pyrophosphatase/phosphodiesterase family member 7-like [Arapaima gigas]
MSTVSRGGPGNEITLSKIPGFSFQDIQFHLVDYGPAGMSLPKEGMLDKVYGALKGAHPHLHVYKKEEIPARLRYSKHPRILSILLYADPGYVAAANIPLKAMRRLLASKGSVSARASLSLRCQHRAGGSGGKLLATVSRRNTSLAPSAWDMSYSSNPGRSQMDEGDGGKTDVLLRNPHVSNSGQRFAESRQRSSVEVNVSKRHPSSFTLNSPVWTSSEEARDSGECLQ